MSTLHLVFSSTWPDSLSKLLGDDDEILLLGAGVAAISTTPCFVLDTAAQARGLAASLPAHYRLIDADAWLALSLKHIRCLSWS